MRNIHDLFNISLEKRNRIWRNEFYTTILGTPLHKGELFVGPDGFAYERVTLVTPDTKEVTYQMSDLLHDVITIGAGVALYDEKGEMVWVFSYGNMCSLKINHFFDEKEEDSFERNGDMVTSGLSSLETRTVQESRKVLIGQPSEFYLPPYARGVLRNYLIKQGIPEPKVFLLNDPTLNPEFSLVFSLFIEDFPSQEVFSQFLRRLSWFLVPKLGIMAVSKAEAEAMYKGSFENL